MLNIIKSGNGLLDLVSPEFWDCCGMNACGKCGNKTTTATSLSKSYAAWMAKDPFFRPE